MIIRFHERYDLPVEEVYAHFRTPADWARIFGFRGDTRELGGGWYSVPLKNFPVPLEVRHVAQHPQKLVQWVFRGFWRGRGEVRFRRTETGVQLVGFEELSVRYLFCLSPILEKLVLERGFQAVWAVGWHRLRKLDRSRRDPGERP